MTLPTKVQNYLAVLTPIGQLTENPTLQALLKDGVLVAPWAGR
jgi:hypothetical protein